MMKFKPAGVILLYVLLLGGCGDQLWCGDNGCEGQVDGNMTDGRYGKDDKDAK